MKITRIWTPNLIRLAFIHYQQLVGQILLWNVNPLAHRLIMDFRGAQHDT